jgi:outer membrane receptor for ferrienterochelin and colicins
MPAYKSRLMVSIIIFLGYPKYYFYIRPNKRISAMKHFFILLLFSAFSAASAQTAVIKGRITSQGKGVPFAAVAVLNSSAGTISDANGYYSILNAPAGTHEIVVSAVGFEKLSQTITVPASGEIVWSPVIREIGLGLGEVVVTGTMKETYVTNSPVKVEVITAEFLRKSPSNNIMEAIQTVNGVQEQINCGVCSTSDIHINGMEGPYTLVLIDGMPIMSALSTVYGLNGIPSSLIERIEVIKGPASTLYGTEAVAGVINVITKKPADVPLVSMNAYATTHLEKNVDFAVAPHMKRSKMLFSGNYYNMNNFIDRNNDNFSDVVLADRVSLFNKWTFDRPANKPFSVSAKYYYEDRYGAERGWKKSDRGSSVIYGESIYTNRVELVGTYRLPYLKENIRLDVSMNHHRQDSYYGQTKYFADQGTWFSNLLWDKRIGGRHDILSGLTLRYQEYNDNTPATPSVDKTFIPGIFVQDEFTATDKLTLLGGMRYDLHSNHGSIFAPRLNLKWKPGSHTTMRLNSGTGFRVVNLFTEDHAALTGSRTVVIEEKLDPEESYNVSLNFQHMFVIKESYANLDIDFFNTYFRNKIIPDYATDQNLIIYDNLDGHSISRGASFAWSHTFVKPFKYSIGGTFLDVFSVQKDPEGNTVNLPELFAPGFAGVFSVSYNIKKYDVSIDYTGKVVGPMHLPTYEEPFSRPERSGWFSLQNIQVTKKARKGFELYFGAKNILDYTQDSPLIDPANPFGDTFDTAYAWGPLQGRRFFLGFRWNLERKEKPLIKEL